ncbi:MAG TPA: O-antigen ligase family protein [Gemmatimonadaceae bacterium]|nr:O-antigen ligase family protein [Gemmatimonadaceae bacterium]
MALSRGEVRAGVADSRWRLVSPGVAVGDHWRFRPLTVVRVALVLMLVGQLGRIPVLPTGTGDAPLLVNDLCVMTMIAAGVMSGLVSQSLRIDRVAGIALLFAALGGISAVLSVPKYGLSAFELLASTAYLARWVVYLGIYVVVINVVRSDDVMTLWHTLEATMLVFAAFGIIQAIFIPHFAQVVYPESRVWIDWDEQGNRLVSTVLEPNIAGGMIILTLIVQLAQLAGGERVALWKPSLMFAAQVATLSRSSFVALFVAGVIILAVRGVSRRMLRFGALIGVAIAAASPKLIQYAQAYTKLEVDASAMTRVTNWLRAIRVFADNPIIGVGFNTFGYVGESYGWPRKGLAGNSTDGGLLFIAVMTGVVGLTLYLWMLAAVVHRCRRVWRDQATSQAFRSLAVGIGAATVAICVQSFFVNSLLTVFVMEPLWILWGIASILAWSIRPTPMIRPLAQLVAMPAATSDRDRRTLHPGGGMPRSAPPRRSIP